MIHAGIMSAIKTTSIKAPPTTILQPATSAAKSAAKPAAASRSTGRSQSMTRPSRASAPLRDRTRTPSKEPAGSIGSKSPTTEAVKKLPPIKAPVGLVPGPDLQKVSSKIGSLQNVKHKPAGGDKKAITQKLEWSAKSRIGSLANANHTPGGGKVKVETQKLNWNTGSRIGSLQNMKHKPGGGQVKIFDEKYARAPRSASEARSPNQLRSPSPTQAEPKLNGKSTASAEKPALAARPTAAARTNGAAPDSKPTVDTSAPRPAVQTMSSQIGVH